MLSERYEKLRVTSLEVTLNLVLSAQSKRSFECAMMIR